LKSYGHYIILYFVCLTKKYKYYQCQHPSILKNVWGEIIKNIGVVLALAIAMLSISAIAQNNYGLAGSGGVDILGTGIFETDGSLARFPEAQDTNIDTLNVGNDKALAFGNIWQKTPVATATNNLEIKKNQDSGVGGYFNTTEYLPDGTEIYGCKDCGIKVNIDQIKVGNREAMAFGFATATNNVKIVANQQ
jgi:hypothetical protein